MDDRYCPSCGSEYRPGFTRCADCDVELVDEPPGNDPVPVHEGDYHPALDPHSLGYVYDPTDWEHGLEPVQLTSLGSELEAEMVVGMLRSNGVRAYLQNESSHGISHYGGQAARSSALALYRVYVHPEDEDEARSLIEEVADDENGPADDPQNAGVMAAPRSGIITAIVVSLAAVLIILMLLFGVSYPD